MEYARTATLVPELERKISLKENDIAFLAGEYPHRIQRSILPEEVNQAAQKWQNRPLNTVYIIVRMDGIVVKVRDNGRIINKTVYLCVGLKQNGLKEVLGMWVGKSESSSFRIGVLTDLKARGVQDILITYADNLNGFTDTIRTVFPSYSLKSVWYIRSETLVNMSFIRTRKSLRQI